MSNKFKNSSGTYFTSALFCDVMEEREKHSALYTLYSDVDIKGLDGKVYKSLKFIYLKMEDVYEREFALACFDSWSHYKKMLRCSWFVEELEKWREELEIRHRSQALKSIRDVANDPLDKNSFNANKFLLAGGWQQSKTKVEKKKVKDASDSTIIATQEVNQDFERLMN